MKALDPGSQPDFVSLEGYLVGRLAVAAMEKTGPACVKSRSDAMIPQVNRQGATDVRLCGGD
jgi:hypothetical protein